VKEDLGAGVFFYILYTTLKVIERVETELLKVNEGIESELLKVGVE